MQLQTRDQLFPKRAQFRSGFQVVASNVNYFTFVFHFSVAWYVSRVILPHMAVPFHSAWTQPNAFGNNALSLRL